MMSRCPFRSVAVAILLAAQASYAGICSVEQKLSPEEKLEIIQALGPSRFSKETAIPAEAVYQPRYSTVCHRVLEQESALGVVKDDMRKLLDDLIEEAKAKKIGAGVADRQGVAAALRQIDELLVGRSFVYPPVGLTQLLSDGLVPRYPDLQERTAIKRQAHNLRRAKHVDDHPEGPFYYVDCDTASVLYLGIGEAVGLPLALVEVPQHNFVRYAPAGGDFINWETMDGMERSDEYYRTYYLVSDAQVRAGTYLRTMSTDNTLGYWHFVVGIPWEQKRLWAQALNEYVLSTTMNPPSPDGWNNAAWILCASRDAVVRNGTRAVEFATRAVELDHSANVLDTLACAYAEAGNFAKAVEIETEACRLGGSEHQHTLNGFLEGKTWLEQNPETEKFAVLNANR